MMFLYLKGFGFTNNVFGHSVFSIFIYRNIIIYVTWRDKGMHCSDNNSICKFSCIANKQLPRTNRPLLFCSLMCFIEGFWSAELLHWVSHLEKIFLDMHKNCCPNFMNCMVIFYIPSNSSCSVICYVTTK